MNKRQLDNKITKLATKFEESREETILMETTTEIIDILKSLNYGDNIKQARIVIAQLKGDLIGGLGLKLKSQYVGIQKTNVEYALSHLPATLLDMAIL